MGKKLLVPDVRLTGNDVALIEMALGMHQSFYEKMRRGGDYRRSQMAKIAALRARLNALFDTAYPPDPAGAVDVAGDVELMVVDREGVKTARREIFRSARAGVGHGR